MLLRISIRSVGRLTATSILIALGATGCSLADAGLYEALPETRDDGGTGVDAGDSSMPDVDSGVDGGTVEQRGVDSCGDDEVYVITGTEEDLLVDTRVFRSTVNSLPGSCNVGAAGNDAFFAVDVQAGEYWHFHLRMSNDDPDPMNRNPILYLLNASCAETQCSRELFANYCDSRQDEHFGFQFNESGRWYIGIDDSNAGGGVYLLDAIRPTCDGTPEHGEACDGGEGCSADCRRILNDESVFETGFNFNVFEANLIELPASNNLTIQGDIGGFEGCAYPDVYAIDIPAGSMLRVDELGADGNPCTGTGASSIQVAIQNRTGMTRATSTAVMGCASTNANFPTEGRFFIVVTDARADRRTPYAYRLRLARM
ncbi:MAG: hypothetical protein H6722_03440 [Sandaracinus sp.]|nr:hypothetical protein [Sandaracinus sp.]